MSKDSATLNTAASGSQLDWIALILIAGAVLCTSWSLAAAEWMPHLDLLTTTVAAAFVLSLLVATRRWRGRTAHCVMFLYGVVWVALVVLNQMPDKVYGFTWLDTLRHMVIRLGEHVYLWGDALATGGVSKDNTIFLMFLAALFWLITYVAVWNTIRHRRIWRAVAPAGVVLLINSYYYGGQHALYPYLILYLFFVLAYAARLYTLHQEQRWYVSRVRFDPEIRRDFLQIGSSIALAAVLIGALAPTVVGAPQLSGLWREISRPMRSIEDSFNRLFAGLEPHGMPYTNPFGRTLALLGPRNLGNELVMEVRSDTSNYLQAMIYDRYTGGAFQSSDTERVDATANTPPLLNPFEQRKAVTQTITAFFPNNSLIFAAPQPVSVNRATWVEAFPDQTKSDFASWSTLNPMGDGDTYEVVSSVSDASIEQLRSAGQSYPPAIRARYLQLPGSLPQRVRDLAQKIVRDAKATTPFDQAAALETWLRANIKYNEQIAAPAPGQDGVDYVLFEAKQGYCDYYASAMAVMARALGIPARIATGYTGGSLDSHRNVYQVYQFNAHTWVEVYFPKYGWVQFEPTASQPLVDRPTQTAANSASPKNNGPDSASANNPLQRPERAPENIDTPAVDFASQSSTSALALLRRLMPLALIGVVLLAAAAAILVAMRVYEERGAPRGSTAGGAWAFARLTRMSRWLRVRLTPAQTPYEQANAIGAAVPRNGPAIDQLAVLYVRERYGRSSTDLTEAQTIWSKLRRPIWKAGLMRRLPRFDLAVRKVQRWFR